MQEFKLDIIWQTGRDAVYVIFFCVAAFRLKEKLMRLLIRELYNLILDRWAIPGSGPFDLAGIERGALKIGANDLMRPFSSVSYPAGHLFHVELSAANAVQRKDLSPVVTNFLFIKGEDRRWFVARLDCAPRKINRACVQATRCARLESTDLKTYLLKIIAEA